ncbi:hypothetical protein [Saccharothrix sp. Mg75]|uniref:hypothetical protein n=1 Tax=Saccharothrix sp. Mg75 TaxID=3445357 RepID=UPI003EE9A38E
MTQQGEHDRLRRMLTTLSDRVRHPDLPLSLFLDPDSVHAMDEDVDTSAWSDDALRNARLRRGAVMAAAHRIVDECIDDLHGIGFPGAGAPNAGEAEESFVHRFFPIRSRDGNDEGFFRKALVTAVEVAQDLADPHGGAAACTAEAIIRAALPAITQAMCEEAGVGAGVLDEYLLEDIDFESLFADEVSGVENDPRLDGTANLFSEGAHDWFASFGETNLVHPYAEPTTARRRVHDLRYRLPTVTGPPRSLDRELDAHEQVAAVGAGSAAVAAARTAADRSDPELWVPDDTDADASFQALLDAVSRAPSGSGGLTWQPFEDDDTIRTDMLIRDPVPALPHRAGRAVDRRSRRQGRAACNPAALRRLLPPRPRPAFPRESGDTVPLIPLPPQGPANAS